MTARMELVELKASKKVKSHWSNTKSLAALVQSSQTVQELNKSLNMSEAKFIYSIYT